MLSKKKGQVSNPTHAKSRKKNKIQCHQRYKKYLTRWLDLQENSQQR
jgi:hypothetical protein